VDVIYLDFSKASDTVSYSILVEKLAARDLDGCTLCWVKNRLDGQVQGDFSLQPMLKTMVRQVVPLQSMEVHGGADDHL